MIAPFTWYTSSAYFRGHLHTPPPLVTLWHNPCGPQWHENPLDLPLSQPISSGSANRTARHVEKSSIETPSVSFACGSR